jgi:hypothetical protein
MIAVIIVIAGMAVLAVFAVPFTERLAESLGEKIGALARRRFSPTRGMRDKIVAMLDQCEINQRVYLYPTDKGHESEYERFTEEESSRVKSAIADLILEYFPEG